MAGSSLFGAGVGVGFLKNTLNQVQLEIKNLSESNKTEHKEIKDRQAKLRGETNGGEPIYMPRVSCLQNRASCMSHTENLLSEHTQDIRALNNFARWFMQEKGLTVIEINDILSKR